MPLPDLESPLAHLEQKNLDAAVEALEQKVTAMPAHLGAHILLAYAYEAQRRWDEALRSWAHAHFLMPNSPLAAAGKRRVLRRMDGRGDGGPPSLADSIPLDLSLPGTPDSATDTAPTERPEDPDSEPNDSELAELRRQADREAQQGGARPGLAGAGSSAEPPAPDDLSTTPEEQVERIEEDGDTDDLDHLIDELQSARIDPDPEAMTDPSAPPDPPADAPADSASKEAEEIVSETLARIHAGQDDYRKAARIYAQLAEQDPDRADEFREKATDMREKADRADTAD